MPSIERRELQAVATAALAWNRARLRRIAAQKRISGNATLLNPAWPEFNAARQAQTKALARLRKACVAADPASLTIDVECEVIEPVVLLG